MGLVSPPSLRAAGNIDSMIVDTNKKRQMEKFKEDLRKCFLSNKRSSPKRDGCYLSLVDYFCEYPKATVKDPDSFCLETGWIQQGETSTCQVTTAACPVSEVPTITSTITAATISTTVTTITSFITTLESTAVIGTNVPTSTPNPPPETGTEKAITALTNILTALAVVVIIGVFAWWRRKRNAKKRRENEQSLPVAVTPAPPTAIAPAVSAGNILGGGAGGRIAGLGAR
ncbi:hypothetical protein TWF281_008972 [Arthrobotrys megalospora]